MEKIFLQEIETENEFIGKLKHDYSNLFDLKYFTGSCSKNKVKFNSKKDYNLYNYIQTWACDNLSKEQCGIVFANKVDDIITPTRFKFAGLTEISKSHRAFPSYEKLYTEINNCSENAAIVFHNHTLLCNDSHQSYGDVENMRDDYWKEVSEKTGVNILHGVATTKHMGIYELDKNNNSVRLDIEVDGKRQYPLPFLLEWFENVSHIVTVKLRNAILDAEKKRENDIELGK